jgi:outer membrane lipoprotein LolB
VESPVDQSLNANFSLTGTALAGALELFGPLGATVAQLRWGPGFAQLRQQGQTNDFPNLPSMLAELTGTTLPTAAVFDWLAGKGLAGVVPPGWSLLEGSEPDTRRLRMVRQTPVPAVRLTILLDDPA